MRGETYSGEGKKKKGKGSITTKLSTLNYYSFTQSLFALAFALALAFVLALVDYMLF